jgi:FkbM family methyltransferase
VVFGQDDVRVYEKFWEVVRAMVRAVPNRVLGLLTNHPLSKRALAGGHKWLRMTETLGTFYIVPSPLLPLYLKWYDAQDPKWIAANCEDFIFSQWITLTGRKTWCPIPSVVQTQDEIPTSHADNPTYPFRKSYLTWEDKRVAGCDLTSVEHWRPETTPPNFGYAVSQDTRYPAGPFKNEEILAAHHGTDALRLRVYPPESDNVRSGIDVVLAGSYNVPGLSFAAPPTILDIGAHVGSASVYFADRFPGATIHAYEPSPENASYARQNLAGIAKLTERAIVGVGTPERVTLFNGKDNTGQRSIHQLGEQRPDGVEVQTMRGRDLPRADLIKLDCEGCELAVLRDYPYLDGVRAIMLEWHSRADYWELIQWMPTLGFKLVRDSSGGKWVADRNLIFIRQPPSEAQKVSLAGLRHEYDLNSLPDLTDPVVLDVGSNVGNFARIALDRWPSAVVHCFEPHPDTFRRLREAEDLAGIEATCAAVTHPARGKSRLYLGVNGDHECSLRDDIVWPPDASDPKTHVSQRLDAWVDVDTVDASTLPPCDVLKIDCEGEELAVLAGYKYLGRVRVMIVEAHAVGGDLRGQAHEIRRIAEAAGLRFVGPDPVVQRFVRP